MVQLRVVAIRTFKWRAAGPQPDRTSHIEDPGSQCQEIPIQPLLDQLLPDHEFPLQLLPDHEFPLQLFPLQLLPDHELPDHEFPLQLLPDHELPFQIPPLQLLPAASRAAIGTDSKACPKMSIDPLRITPSRVR